MCVAGRGVSRGRMGRANLDRMVCDVVMHRYPLPQPTRAYLGANINGRKPAEHHESKERDLERDPCPAQEVDELDRDGQEPVLHVEVTQSMAEERHGARTGCALRSKEARGNT